MEATVTTTQPAQPQQEEMRVCTECGRSLPLHVYRRTRFGSRWKICPDCCKAIRAEKLAERQLRPAEPTPAFLQGKTPREVLDIMSACKRYLENIGGYEIKLSGVHKKTVITQLKF